MSRITPGAPAAAAAAATASTASTGARPGGASGLRRWLPPWARAYDREMAGADLLAALVVTLMLIPQSLAYAQLAGLPPQVGLYASIAPLVAYAAFGTSSALAVGPAAVLSLMTAAALGPLHLDPLAHLAAAAALAGLSGLMLAAAGLLRLGFVADFLGHPVISGFVTASGLLIALGQVKHLLGVPAHGDTLPELVASLWPQLGRAHLPTALLGAGVLAWLAWTRRSLAPTLRLAGLPAAVADALARAAPVAALLVSTAAVSLGGLAEAGVRIVGTVPAGLPPLAWPALDADLLARLALPAALISLVGFVESVSVARTFAARRGERLDDDRELVGLGAANLAAAVTGGYPVTGGFSRSVVNFDAGARTPMAGVMTAGGLLLATLLLTPWLRDLPQAALAATIVVAVLSLVDLRAVARTWRYSRADGACVALTIAATLAAGVERGILAGVALSVLTTLWRASRPHVAIVGRVPGTEHFRNVERHAVETLPGVLGVRIDESLWFANARFLERWIDEHVAADASLRDLVLQCSAVNSIDASALDSLAAIDARLRDRGVRLHLSEVKGPVMDRLQRSDLLARLSGEVFLAHHDAIVALGGERH